MKKNQDKIYSSDILRKVIKEKLKAINRDSSRLFYRLNPRYAQDEKVQEQIRQIHENGLNRYVAINPEALELRFTELIERDIESELFAGMKNNVRPDSSHAKLSVWSMVDIEKETGSKYGTLRHFMQSKEYGTILGKSIRVKYEGEEWSVFPAKNAIKFSEAVKSYKRAQV